MAPPPADMHTHERLTAAQYRRMHGVVQLNGDAYYHNAEPHQHRSSPVEQVKSYGRPIANAEWDVPVRLIAEERNGEIVKLTIMPKESFAGYFGRESQVMDGDSAYDDKEGMWDGIADYLSANKVYGSDDRFFLHWES